ncbi:MAG: hypothetical protein WA990_04095 [Rubrobacteraceae bacterium]
MQETSGIGFKEAAAIARQFVLDLYEDTQEGEIQNVLLEEIEYERHRRIWSVTIGFDRKHIPPPSQFSGGIGGAFAGLGPQYRRALKRVEVDGETGEVLRMIEREFED